MKENNTIFCFDHFRKFKVVTLFGPKRSKVRLPGVGVAGISGYIYLMKNDNHKGENMGQVTERMSELIGFTFYRLIYKRACHRVTI